MEEMVNHPSHYNIPGRKECIVEIEEKYGAEYTAVFCLTNAYKYIYRAGNKRGNPIYQDISKAYFYFNYANMLIEKYESLYFNGEYIKDSKLYFDINKMLSNYEK